MGSGSRWLLNQATHSSVADLFETYAVALIATMALAALTLVATVMAVLALSGARTVGRQALRELETSPKPIETRLHI
jgi:hypothetical protein